MVVSADTSILSDYFEGKDSIAIAFLEQKITNRQFVLIWPTIMELFSNPAPLKDAIKDFITSLPCIDFDEETWMRAAKNRAFLRAKKLKAHFAYALIAQSCIDAGIPLLTRDADVKHFEVHCGLKLVQVAAH